MNRDLERRLGALERSDLPRRLYSIVFIDDGESAEEAKVRAFPDGPPAGRRLMMVSWLAAGNDAIPAARRIGI